MKQVIAMHGWSGDSRSWGPWGRHFQNHGWIWQSSERGYGSLEPRQLHWQDDPDPAARQRRVVIAHSLGPHLLASPLLAEATDVVLLASFSRFVPQGRAGRALQTGLQGMERCIGTSSESSMLQTFLERAAAPTPTSALPPSPVNEGLSETGRQRLLNDLQLLMATTGLLTVFQRGLGAGGECGGTPSWWRKHASSSSVTWKPTSRSPRPLGAKRLRPCPLGTRPADAGAPLAGWRGCFNTIIPLMTSAPGAAPLQLVVCGTDTDVGKTVVSALPVQGLQAQYWKPVQSGLEQEAIDSG